MLQDPHSRQQQQQPPHPPSSERQQQQQQQRGVRRQDNPWPPAPGITAERETAARPSAAKLNLAGIVWRKVWLAAAAVKDWEVHNTMHRGDTLRWLLCRQICVPQPLRSCRCPGAGAGEGEEAGNYSALIYDNIIHRLNVCELVKSGFSVSIPPVLGPGTLDSGQ